MTESIEFDIYEWMVIYKLTIRKYIGNRHTSEDNVAKGFPKHERGKIKDALYSLIKRGIVIYKPTSYGIEVSLNPHYQNIKEIMEKSIEVMDQIKSGKSLEDEENFYDEGISM